MGPIVQPLDVTQQRVFEHLKVRAQTSVGQRAILHVQQDPSALIDGLLVTLEAKVLAERIVSGDHSTVVTIDFPTSPWQLFKQRHESSWWLRWLVMRRPVRTAPHSKRATLTIETFRTYPEAKVVIPDLGRPVVVETARWSA